jgi:hypothetical protein
MIFSTSMRASLREMPEWKGRIVGVRDGQRVCKTIFFVSSRQRIRLVAAKWGENSGAGVLTHALEHLGGDAGALADETEHDLR